MSSKTKHTPGPWLWLQLGDDWHLVSSLPGRPVVLTTLYVSHGEDYDPPGHEVMALGEGKPRLLVPLTPGHPDARLIAAAPEMLAALKAARGMISAGVLGFICGQRATAEDYEAEVNRVTDLINAAIEKAEGP